MRWAVLGMCLAVACRSGRPLKTMRVAVDTVTAQQGVPVVGPVRWVEQSGLVIDVPEGWSGTESGHPRLVLVHEQSRVTFRAMTADAVEGEGCSGGGWSLLQEGPTRSHALRQVRNVHSWTGVSDTPNGPTRQCWSVEAPGAAYLLVMEYPFGQAVAGRVTALEVLHGVATQTSAP